MNVHANPKRTAAEAALIDGYAVRSAALPGDAATREKRGDAIAMLKRCGLPSRRVEAWHYTDLRRLLSAVPDFPAVGSAKRLEPLIAGATVLEIVDGMAGDAPAVEGVEIRPLRDKLADGSFAPALDIKGGGDAIGMLNAAYVSDGFFLDIATGAAPAMPIEIQNLQSGGQSHVRLPVRVGDGARAVILERQGGSGDGLASSVSHLMAGEDAEIIWIIVQEKPETAVHLGQFNARLARGAKLTLFVMNAGGRLVRQEVRVEAAGEGGDFRLRAINLLSGETHCDVTMMLDHLARDTSSTEIVRNIVTDRAQGAFQGQIRVAQGAQKTDAKMACNTLLLSDESGYSTKPELEIFADDVQCGHGATMAEIDRGQLFYLMSRGIDEKSARGLLVKAFLAEIIEELEDERIVGALEKRLDGWFAEHG